MSFLRARRAFISHHMVVRQDFLHHHRADADAGCQLSHAGNNDQVPRLTVQPPPSYMVYVSSFLPPPSLQTSANLFLILVLCSRLDRLRYCCM